MERCPQGHTYAAPTAAQAARYLVDRFGARVRDVAPLGQGAWSRAFAYRLGDGEYVIRFSALAEDFQKDARAAAYATPALPIPAMHELGTAFGGHYAIAARARGGYLDDLDEAGMRGVLPSLFAALDAMREVDISRTGGYGLWGGQGVAPHPSWRAALLDAGRDHPGLRTHGWRSRLAGSPTGDGPFAAAFAQLQALAAGLPEDRHLVHSDLLNFNVLVADSRISAVLDWGSALYGDFLYDVAWLCFWSAWYPSWRGIDFSQEAARHYAVTGWTVPELETRLRAYQIHIGLDGQAYNAFQGRWDAVASIARRTLAIAGLAG